MKLLLLINKFIKKIYNEYKFKQNIRYFRKHLHVLLISPVYKHKWVLVYDGAIHGVFENPGEGLRFVRNNKNIFTARNFCLQHVVEEGHHRI
jgi:hypothetical protein